MGVVRVVGMMPAGLPVLALHFLMPAFPLCAGGVGSGGPQSAGFRAAVKVEEERTQPPRETQVFSPSVSVLLCAVGVSSCCHVKCRHSTLLLTSYSAVRTACFCAGEAERISQVDRGAAVPASEEGYAEAGRNGETHEGAGVCVALQRI